MRWGRRFGHMVDETGFRRETKWGAEQDEYSPGRVMVKKIRGKIVPCDSCKRIYKCPMYHSFTRYKIRNGEYAQGTNIMQWCDIYLPNHIPQKIRRNFIVE